MSDSSPPPKPKPGSLRDRIAAFEQKPSSAPAPPPPAPRPKPGNLSQWKPRPSSPPHDTQPVVNRTDHSMSANDAKESITKAGSLKERMAALQGLGAFGGGPAAAPPPRPAEKPKWKPPPQVAVALPVTGDDDEGDNSAPDNKPAISPLRRPSGDDMLAALSKAQPPPAQEPAQEGASEVTSEEPVGGEDAPDPEEEERQRRAAIAARMARLGGTRVGVGPPIFGRKPEIKPKPAELAPETTKEGPSTVDIRVAESLPRSEGDIEQAVEAEVTANVPLPTSPPTNESVTESLSPQLQVTPSENFPQQPPASESPHIPLRSMPVPQGPRRAAPPRKKSSQKQTPPAEPEATTPSFGKDTSIHDVPETVPGSQITPVSVPVEPEVDAVADPNANVRLAETADENLEPISPSSNVTAQQAPSPEAGPEPAPPPIPPPPPLGPHSESPDELEVELRPKQGLPSPDDVAESVVPSIPAVPRITQEEAETVVVPEYNEDETPVAPAEEDDEDETARKPRIAERVAKMGGFNPFGGQPMRSPTLEDEPSDVERKGSGEVIPVEGEGTTPQSEPAALAAPTIPYSVFQQGGSVTVNEEGDDNDDGNDESDLHAQAPLQHGLGDPSMGELEGAINYHDAHARVAHEVEVETFTQTAEIEQGPETHGAVRDADDAAAPSPPRTVQGQYATGDDFGVAHTHAEDEPLAFALSTSTDDTSDCEMAPPRVTRPLPPAPAPPAPGVSPDLSAIFARVPPPPAIPKRTSLPPPTRAVPVPSLHSPPPAQGSSPQRAPPTKRASLLPPSREIPIPTPDSPDATLQGRQPPSRRTSFSPPSRAVPSPSISREGSLVVPPPPPPPPPSLGYSEQEPWGPGQTKEAPQVRDEPITPPPHVLTPTRKPSIAPPTPDGRRSMESRRSTDLRPSHEERRGSGQYAAVTTTAVPGPTSPPSKKRVPPSLPLEREVLDDNIGDPIDPRFLIPSRSPDTTTIPHSPPPISGTDTLSSASPATPPPVPPANESEGNGELKRRKTIADRMAKLGGIKFGAPPPPVNRVPAPAPAQPTEDADAEGTTTGPGQPALEEDEEDEQARRQRIAAKLAGMGGMRFGMLPIQQGMGVVPPPPPPPIPTRPEEEATPRSPPRAIPPPRQPTARYPEPDQEYEHPSSSDDGVQVEAEESELEEVHHEDFEDEYGVEDVEEDRWGTPPPPPPPRSTRPPIPSTRPPPIPPIGRRPSLEVSLSSGRTGSFDTITSIPRPPARHATSDFVMVEAEEAPLAPPAPSSRGPQPLPSVSQSLEPSDLAGTGHWELPSIPSGSFELHDSGVGSDLSGSMWSEDSVIYPPATPPSAPLSRSPPPAGMSSQSTVGQQPRAPAAVTARMTADELRAVWYRVGAHVAEAAVGLFERSKRTLVGTGSYEGFIAEALVQVPNALPPHKPGEYGFLIYAQTAAQVHTRLTDIMPGDVVVIEGAKLKGHKSLHTYSMSVGEASPCMGIVSEFDAKKLKLKALQANQRVGQATVESVSYRLEDLKSGTIKVYRVQEA